MADTVTTQTIADTSGVKFVAKLTNFSDGTGETLVKKIDASEVTFMTEDANRKISRVWYSINTANAKSGVEIIWDGTCLLYTSPSPRDRTRSRMPSSA